MDKVNGYHDDPIITDFSTWDRKTLERFAQEAASENRELRANQRNLLDYIRKLMAENDRRN
jgi:hypothetical protein